MIRIMTADEPARTVIIVDGNLSGDAVEPLKVCCLQALSTGRPVRLFLRDVSAIDERGRRMLVLLAARGVTLAANGIYISYLIDEIKSESLKNNHSLRFYRETDGGLEHDRD